MSYLDDLTTRRDAVAAELAALDATKAGGKPDSAAAGIAHTTYKKSLYDELAQINTLIDQAQEEGDGPTELTSIAFSG